MTGTLLYYPDEVARRLTPIRKKLQRMAEWQSGWSYGEGEPISPHSTQKAEEYATKMLELGLDSDVFPNLDGGCAVVAYRKDTSVELTITARGAVRAAITERGVGSKFEVTDRVSKPTSRQVMGILKRLEAEWRLSDSWIFATTMVEECGSEILSAAIPRASEIVYRRLPMAKAASLSLMCVALNSAPIAYVHTLHNTTPMSQEFHAHYG